MRSGGRLVLTTVACALATSIIAADSVEDLGKQRADIGAKKRELQQKLAGGKSVSKDLLKLLTELREVSSKLGALHARHNAPDYGRLRGIWSAAKAAHVAKLRSDPDIVEAEEQLGIAQRELVAAVEEELMDSKAVKGFLGERAELDAALAALDFQASIARYRLYDQCSPIKMDVDQDKKVKKLYVKWRDIENSIRSDPSRAELKAREAHDKARAESKKVEQDIRQDKAYQAAYQAKRAAEAALRAASQSDPRMKQLADARAAYDQLLGEKIRSLKGAKKLLAEQAKIEKARQETEAAAPGTLSVAYRARYCRIALLFSVTDETHHGTGPAAAACRGRDEGVQTNNASQDGRSAPGFLSRGSSRGRAPRGARRRRRRTGHSDETVPYDPARCRTAEAR